MSQFFGKNTVSRIAPTPSGYLHKGNAFNFLLTWWMVRSEGGQLWLRIDDADTARRRDEFLDDIFESLKWLGLDWDKGPKNRKDFLENFSQDIKKESYFHLIKERKDIYACDCSRKQIRERATGPLYDGFCRERGLEKERGQNAFRLKAPEEDFVVWRKDDIPAYHLASVSDDQEAGVNLVVRGMDLLPSTNCQKVLARILGMSDFEKTLFFHHPLILDSKGEKISKSQSQGLGEEHLKFLRERGQGPQSLIQDFARSQGIDPLKIKGPEDLLSFAPPALKPD